MPLGIAQSLIRGTYWRTDAQDIRANVFFRGGGDGHLRDIYWDGSAWSTTGRARVIVGQPAMILRGKHESVSANDIKINGFSIGTNGHLYEVSWDGTRWVNRDHGGSLTPGILMFGRGNFGSISNGAIRINSFACGTNGHLLEFSWNGSKWVWADHGGSLGGGMAATGRGNFSSIQGSGVRINMFMRSSSGTLMERYWNGSNWGWGDHGGNVLGTPTMLSRGDLWNVNSGSVRINLVIAGANGHLMQHYWDGSQWMWVDHGGSVDGSPIMIGRGNFDSTDASGIRINVFIRGTNGHLMALYWDGSVWGWGDIGGDITSAPLQWIGHGNFCSLDERQIRIRIFAHGTNNQLIEYHWDPDPNTSGYYVVDHGGDISSDLLAPLLQGDRTNPAAGAVNINMFAVGTNGKLHERYWNGSEWAWGEEH
jgi:hypothetical protein